MKQKQINPVFIPTTFHAKKDHIEARIQVGDMSLNLHFMSPEHIAEFCDNLILTAAQIWPDHELIKAALSEDE